MRAGACSRDFAAHCLQRGQPTGKLRPATGAASSLFSDYRRRSLIDTELRGNYLLIPPFESSRVLSVKNF